MYATSESTVKLTFSPLNNICFGLAETAGAKSEKDIDEERMEEGDGGG